MNCAMIFSQGLPAPTRYTLKPHCLLTNSSCLAREDLSIRLTV